MIGSPRDTCSPTSHGMRWCRFQARIDRDPGKLGRKRTTSGKNAHETPDATGRIAVTCYPYTCYDAKIYFPKRPKKLAISERMCQTYPRSRRRPGWSRPLESAAAWLRAELASVTGPLPRLFRARPPAGGCETFFGNLTETTTCCSSLRSGG